MEELRPALVSGAEQLGVQLTAGQADALLQYLAEFSRWNKAYNLSAVRDPRQMLSRHILDSLSVVPHLANTRAQRIIDVGTGGGLPGMVLAIVFPQRHFTLLDSNGKKTRFLFHCKTLLGLDNLAVENGRVEAFAPAEMFDLVISRAFASLEDMTRLCRHLLAPGGLFMAMKGAYPEAELAALAEDYQLLGSHELVVPGTQAQRCLLLLRTCPGGPSTTQ